MAKKEDGTSAVTAVRVLQDCHFGRADAVVEVDADLLEAAKADGLVDDHPDAVAYAVELARTKKLNDAELRQRQVDEMRAKLAELEAAANEEPLA